MAKFILIIFVVIFSPSANCSDAAVEKERAKAYEDALALGRCAGWFSFMSKVYDSSGKKYQAEDAAMKSNGWRIASMGALYAAGWRGERVSITSNSIYEGAFTNWMAKIEMKSDFLLAESEQERSFCLLYNDAQEAYRKQYKLLINKSSE